jgi:hypothetical protein
VILLPVLLALRAIRAVVFTAGVGALVAAAAAVLFSTTFGQTWGTSLFAFGLTLGLTLLAAAVTSFLLTPSHDALVRDGDQPLPLPLVLVLVALCGFAALQVPTLLAWLAEDRSLLGLMGLERRGPPNMNDIPIGILFSLPAIAAATLISCALTSLLTILAPAPLAGRALASSVRGLGPAVAPRIERDWERGTAVVRLRSRRGGSRRCFRMAGSS